jgi:hypothetical protein
LEFGCGGALYGENFGCGVAIQGEKKHTRVKILKKILFS